jgi:hypothetical protein
MDYSDDWLMVVWIDSSVGWIGAVCVVWRICRNLRGALAAG